MAKFIVKSREGKIMLIDAEDKRRARADAKGQLVGTEDQVISADKYVDIFERLRASNTPHAICKNGTSLFGSNDSFGSEWFIAIINQPNMEMKKLGFKKSVNERYLLEYSLQDFEVKHFKSSMSKYYVRAKSTSAGKVWEQIGNSLKERYDELRVKALEISVDGKTFERILSSEQDECYKDVTDYWSLRLKQNEDGSVNKYNCVIITSKFLSHKEELVLQLRDIMVGNGKSMWGAAKGAQHYVLKLGKMLSHNY